VAYGKLRRIYIVEGGYKREPEPVASPQSTILHSTGNISVKEGSQPQQYRAIKTTGTLVVLCTRVLLCSVVVCCGVLLCVRGVGRSHCSCIV
jgi:hypothetical protein